MAPAIAIDNTLTSTPRAIRATRLRTKAWTVKSVSNPADPDAGDDVEEPTDHRHDGRSANHMKGRTMKMILMLTGLLAVLVSAGCSPSSAEAGSSATAAETSETAETTKAAAVATDKQTARSAVATMLTLAEAGDWGGYVDQFYGEAHKFSGPEDRNSLVKRFEDKWGAKILPALQRASKLEPTIDADGRALFADTGETVLMLYKHTDGRWTFHL